MVISSSSEVSPGLSVSTLGISGRSVDGVVEAVCITKEIVVSDCTIVVSIDFGDQANFLICKFKFEEGEDLLELLLRNLEVVVTIPVLEETLGIEPFFSNNFSETIKDSLHSCLFFTRWSNSSVGCVESCSSNSRVKVLLESLGSEDFIDAVAEILPADVVSSFWGLELSFELLKFRV